MSRILDSGDISRALKRIAHEIIEHNHGVFELTILGIPTRGAFLGQRLAAILGDIEGHTPFGAIDITLHRDDLRLRPPRPLLPTEIPIEGIEGRDVILVDDVLYSGRTIRAALDAIGEIGRPRSVQLAVLVDRGHRQLPIRADYVGKNIPTSSHESVRVSMQEIDGFDAVDIEAGEE